LQRKIDGAHLGRASSRHKKPGKTSKMKIRNFAGAAVVLGLAATAVFAQADRLAIQSQPAMNGNVGWHLGPSFPDPTGFTMVDPDGTVHVIPREERPKRMRVPGGDAGPSCSHSPVCGRKHGAERNKLARVEWDQNMGYKFSYPYVVPKGIGGIPSVALDSKGNLWVFKRSPAGVVQLMKFDAGHKLVLSVPEAVIGHQDKAHGMAVDAQDNVWITDNGQATVMKLSPEGKLLMTLGTKGKRGDWVEDKNQRLLWQPVMVAFAPNGDLYIAEGHANESPNDVDSSDPANVEGVARIIHLTKDGKFVGQWFGNEVGQGKFDSTHGLAIDPKNGDVWIGDREQYRIVVYTADGKFVKTLQMKNLVCALGFDHQGNPWMASGQDGQFLKLDHDGHVLGAVGNGMGVGTGQFTEASYWVFDKHDNLIAGDTSVGRVTVMSK
jgi:DNA-binding beta-propeller fold protein YncE